MRPSDLLVEVWRNVRSGTARAAPYALALAAAVGALAVADARSVVDLHRDAAAYVAAGASVRVLTTEDSVDGVPCEALAGVPGVSASGALSEGTALTLAVMPDNPVPVYEVTTGMAGVLGTRAESAAGVWVSEYTAELLGVGPGQEFGTDAGPMTVAGVFPYPDDGRDSRLRYAVLVPERAEGTYSECWADTRPPTDRADELLMWAVRTGADPAASVNVGQLNTTLGAGFDGAAAFAERTTRFAAPAAVLVGFVLGFTAVRLRRLELASALHVGVSRRALLVQTSLETLLWAVAGLLLVGCALAVAVRLGNPADPWETLAVSAPTAVAAGAAALAGAVAAVCRVREEHLFRYFKDR
ncbi:MULTISPECIES: hypothetical protein [unclassified Nocardiopsis]|uniref:hypothetical protein n=1 Tax=unclassified Nocardiopsis TaxID=2649073 RepID=UPI0033FF550F